MSKYFILSFSIIAALLNGCKPNRDDDFELPDPSAAPTFSIEVVQGDSNRMVIKDLSSGGFQRIWQLPGGTPKTSAKALDTVFYDKAGEYKITLFVSKSDGSGTVLSVQKVTIRKDAPITCTPKQALLTGDCNPQGKCWTFSKVAGAVRVGPSYDDFSWFTSIANGLQPTQYDDGFCFTFQNLVFQNKPNGSAVNPWNGYQAEAYNPPPGEYVFLEGSGANGRDQIIIPNDQFMGVWDCDNVLDVVKLTATELVVRGRQREPNGVPKVEGWFELKFIPK